MEGDALGDLVQGPVVRQRGDVTLTLSVDDTGTANLSAARKGKPLAAIPPDVTALRLAHPDDLFRSGTWSLWQRDCFRANRVQPFKQIFRELYPMTETERDLSLSRRYAGHQVNPRQALSLFGGRGWVAHPEHGVNRTFHDEGLTARLTFQDAFYTPADVEGLTIEAVAFTKKGEWDALLLQDIPPRVFSETTCGDPRRSRPPILSEKPGDVAGRCVWVERKVLSTIPKKTLGF